MFPGIILTASSAITMIIAMKPDSPNQIPLRILKNSITLAPQLFYVSEAVNAQGVSAKTLEHIVNTKRFWYFISMIKGWKVQITISHSSLSNF